MFGQDDNQQNDQNLFGQDINAPAPGAPVGPVTHDDAPVSGSPFDSPVTEQPTAPAPTSPAGSDELLDIKQEALQSLTPLVGHLEQSPEEKFRTTMMMIQAADDQSLLRTAYEAAKQIEDEKTRAQALLDVVNEINYFTQQHNN